MTTRLSPEVKQQWVTLVLGWVTVCTTHVSDGSVAHECRPKYFLALFSFNQRHVLLKRVITISHINSLEKVTFSRISNSTGRKFN